MNGYYNIPWLHLRVGQRVTMHDDERHVGRIDAIHDSVVVKVRWLDTGWVSFESAKDLQRA